MSDMFENQPEEVVETEEKDANDLTDEFRKNKLCQLADGTRVDTAPRRIV